MRSFLIIPAFFLFVPLLFGSGCSNIDVPMREQTEGAGTPTELTISLDHAVILDTEPLVLSIDEAVGIVAWHAEPDLGGRFEPETGESVLFVPPNISGECVIIIIAEDDKNHSGRIAITVLDEGEPPGPGDVLINEIAWAGTLTSVYDEYIELVNSTDRPFYLNNWTIDNAGGTGTPLRFSGKIEQRSFFVIANYGEESEKSALDSTIQFEDSGLSISNNTFGPFVLRNGAGEAMDSVGDGAAYTDGLNTPETRASLARFTWSTSTHFNAEHWYTESISINLSDGTRGTPGVSNSDISIGGGPSEDDASAILTEFAIDPDDGIGEDWAEMYIVRSGSIRNFILTDLDGDDAPITHGADMRTVEGEYYLIIWHAYEDGYDFDTEGYLVQGNRIHIPDNPPTGTKDQIVLLCGSLFLDCLCYYTEGNELFDNDEQQMRSYGWTGDPILGKYGAKKVDVRGDYFSELCISSWDTGAVPSPGARNAE